MPRRSLVLGLTALLGAAACGRGSSVAADSELKRDLDMAGAASVQMTPGAPRTQVVSAIEGGEAPKPAPEPKAAPRPSPRPTVARHTPAPRRAPTPVTQVASRTEAPAPTPEPAPEPTPAPVEAPAPVVATPAPAPEPAPAPRRMPEPRGRQGRGTWTVGDVIRNAPFPILP